MAITKRSSQPNLTRQKMEHVTTGIHPMFGALAGALAGAVLGAAAIAALSNPKTREKVLDMAEDTFENMKEKANGVVGDVVKQIPTLTGQAIQQASKSSERASSAGK